MWERGTSEKIRQKKGTNTPGIGIIRPEESPLFYLEACLRSSQFNRFSGLIPLSLDSSPLSRSKILIAFVLKTL